MIERLSFVVLLLALFLISADSPRVGEEERRIWTPFVFGCMIVVVLLRLPLLMRIDQRILTNPTCWLFALYLMWIALCQLWSIDAGEGQYHVLLLGLAFVAILSAGEVAVYRTTVWVIGITALVMAASWTGLAAGFRFALSRTEFWRLKGIMAHEQTLALICIAAMIMAAVWYCNQRRCGLDGRWRLIAGFAFLALATLLAAKARSFSVFFVITVVALAVVHARGNRRAWVALLALAALGSLGVLFELILPLFERSHQDATLSGRTVVWAMSWREIENAPVLGHGFATYPGYFEKLWNNWFPAHAHNLWLHVWFENGIIGLILITAFLAAVIRQGLRFQRQTGLLSYSLFLAVFIAFASLMSVVIGGKLTTLYGLLILVAVQEDWLRHQARDFAQNPA